MLVKILTTRFYYHRNWIIFYLFFAELNLPELKNRLSLNPKLPAEDLIFYTRDIPCKYAQIFVSRQIKLLRYVRELKIVEINSVV